MLIAIDHGNYAIKTPRFSFVAGLSEHATKPPLADEVIEYGGSYWTLSGRRLPYMRDKTRDDRHFILSLFAIAKELANAGCTSGMEKVDLAVGLPPEHYKLRDRFAQYFKRAEPVSFSYNDHPMSVSIQHVFVYPQAYAAVIPQSSQLLKTLRMFVVDIGGITTDVLLLRNGKPDLQVCRSLESGVITMNKVVQYAKDYLEDNESYKEWSYKRDGASQIARLLFEEATDINFFVGRAINPAHQNPNLPINFNIKMRLVDELADCLTKMGKKLKVLYF